MQVNTKVRGTLLVSSDGKECLNTDLETAFSAQLSSLKTTIYGEGLELYELGEKRKSEWADGVRQIRCNFTLIVTRRRTKNQIYQIINGVRAQPLAFQTY